MIYIVYPEAHGNGGWCGSEVKETHEKIEDALRHRPDFFPVHCPYGGRLVNGPRICKSEDPNDALYVWDEYDGWEKFK